MGIDDVQERRRVRRRAGWLAVARGAPWGSGGDRQEDGGVEEEQAAALVV